MDRGEDKGSRKRPKRRSALLRLLRTRRAKKPGSVAGIELEELATLPSTTAPVAVTSIDYSPDQAQVTRVDGRGRTSPRPTARSGRRCAGSTWTASPTWRVIRGLAEKYHLHPLAVEDLLNTTHRPKVEAYQEEGRLPGAALHHRQDAGAGGRPPARRADQHVPRPPHGAHVPGEPGRRLGRDPPAHPDAGLAPAGQRRQLPGPLAARRDRGQLLPDPRVLRRPPRGRRGRGAAAADPRRRSRRSTRSSASCCCCAAPSGRCAR